MSSGRRGWRKSGVVEQIDSPDGQVVRRAPVGIEEPKILGGSGWADVVSVVAVMSLSSVDGDWPLPSTPSSWDGTSMIGSGECS